MKTCNVINDEEIQQNERNKMENKKLREKSMPKRMHVHVHTFDVREQYGFILKCIRPTLQCTTQQIKTTKTREHGIESAQATEKKKKKKKQEKKRVMQHGNT